MQNVAITIVTSLVVALCYGLFISNKEDAIRSYLKNTTHRFIKRIYVNAFVSAVRGKDKVSDTSNIVCILLLLCLFSGLTLYGFTNGIVQKYDSNFERFQNLDKQLTEEQLKAEKEELDQLFCKMGESIGFMRVFNKALFFGGFAFFYAGWFAWRPYLLMTKKFSHEMEIYLHRIQGLASKQELSQLAVAESKVKSEESLKSFIMKTKEIASRYDVEELVSTFDLWK